MVWVWYVVRTVYWMIHVLQQARQAGAETLVDFILGGFL
jgi:hypothetical protein